MALVQHIMQYQVLKVSINMNYKRKKSWQFLTNLSKKRVDMSMNMILESKLWVIETILNACLMQKINNFIG